jgi:hypothetical protein
MIEAILWIIVFLVACVVVTVARIAVTRVSALRDQDAAVRRMQDKGQLN